MLHFDTDYMRGAHPAVMERLVETNLLQTPGYGADEYTAHARELILKACGLEDGKVLFLAGGTQTNATVIDSVLARQEGVLAVETSHINVHEAGAVEATGHKVLTVHSADGKLKASDVKELVMAHYADTDHEHCVQPGMVYVSFPTETGTLYSKKELEQLSGICCELGLPLFIDGARLGYGLMADGNDLTLPEIARMCDVFTIGGTKCGALFGEAVVFTGNALGRDFRYLIKQNGGMLAKGRLLGLQFLALLSDGIYFEISKRAGRLAMKVRTALEAAGLELCSPCTTNQQFVYMPVPVLEKLEEKYVFSVAPCGREGWRLVRICTSWATTDDADDALIADISACMEEKI